MLIQQEDVTDLINQDTVVCCSAVFIKYKKIDFLVTKNYSGEYFVSYVFSDMDKSILLDVERERLKKDLSDPTICEQIQTETPLVYSCAIGAEDQWINIHSDEHDFDFKKTTYMGCNVVEIKGYNTLKENPCVKAKLSMI